MASGLVGNSAQAVKSGNSRRRLVVGIGKMLKRFESSEQT